MKLALRAPHQKYFNRDGKQRPGVTTVLGMLAKPPLIPWAADEEREGILRFMGDTVWSASSLRAALPEARFHATKRDKAADLGTITHARIEAWLRGETLDPDDLPVDLYEQSVNGFDRFRRWWDGKAWRLVASELQMVSETMQVGGTMDVGAARDNYETGISVVDIKSSKMSKYWPYKEHKSQAQTYGRIWSEVNNQPVREVWLYRCGTTPNDPGMEYQLKDSERAAGDRLFDGALLAYNAAGELEN